MFEEIKAMLVEEMSIDEAIYSFLKEEGQEYFTKHMEEFALIKEDYEYANYVKEKASEINITREEWYEIYRAAGNILP